MSVVDEAVRRVLRVKFALGLFEHPYAEGTEVTAAVAEHRPLVRKAAEEACAAEERERWTGSPLLPCPHAKKIALIGPLADNSGEMTGHGAARKYPDIVTMKEALEARPKKAADRCVCERHRNSERFRGRIRGSSGRRRTGRRGGAGPGRIERDER